ncbi:heterokaryon incompatibility protein-domain-containing protein [Leptodontidium sp. MPI-SDFR-AT-0119]|nr:heterokaryon incompatibility protein-domain-containing protein [Leptodontidium sp. MPI-SDFR-AT-0119]
MQPYQYSTLSKEHEIRLLKFGTTPSSNQQQHSLIHTTIHQAPAYETLSYVWGPGVRDRVLILHEGFALYVTENLERAILGVSQHCSTGYIWIDQICINQDNVAERNEQVKLMGRVYGSCFQVLVWLGSIDLPHCDAVDWVCRVANEAAVGTRDPTVELQTLLTGDVVMKNGEAVLYQEDEELAIWQFYKQLGCAWFSRGWVFQEIVLPSRSKFILSSGSVSLQGLNWICKAIQKNEGEEVIAVGLDEVTLESGTGFNMVPMMYRSWAERHDPMYSFSHAVQNFEDFISAVVPAMKTSDPRDCIYAVLGLNDDPFVQIQPDYRHSTEEVFASTTRAIIQGSQRLDILDILCRQGDGDGTRPFFRRSPSWVPDFRASEHLTRFSKSTASVLPSEHGRMYPHVGACDLAVLIAHGRVLDRVQSRIDPRVAPPHVDGMQFDFLRIVSSAGFAWESSSRTYPKPTNNTVFAAILAQGHFQMERVHSLFEKAQEGNVNIPDILASVVNHLYYGDKAKLEVKAPNQTITESSRTLINEALDAIKFSATKRFLYITKEGRLALGCTLEVGDYICILHGCSNPIALRKAGGGRFHVQETCFLEDWMDPWTRNKVDWKEDEATEFLLI